MNNILEMTLTNNQRNLVSIDYQYINFWDLDTKLYKSYEHDNFLILSNLL